MKRNRLYTSPSLPSLFLQGIIILFFAVSIFFLSSFRKTWLFSFDGISEEVQKKITDTDKRSFYYGEKYPYDIYGVIYENIDWLSENMTQLEAKKVLNYPSPVIRIAAYRSLLNYNSESKFDKNPKRDYELLCQVLQEYDILQASLGDCGVWVVPTGWFFSQMYFFLDDDAINYENYPNDIKKKHNLTDSELKHLIHLYQVLEQKRLDFWELHRSM